jgi:hypothetical protein
MNQNASLSANQRQGTLTGIEGRRDVRVILSSGYDETDVVSRFEGKASMALFKIRTQPPRTRFT